MSFRYIIFLCFFLAIPSSIIGQKKSLKKLENFIQSERFKEGASYADSIESNKKKYFYLKGICYFHLRNLDQALEDFSRAYSLGYDQDEILWYLGNTHHLKHQFNEAAQAYKLYLNNLKEENPARAEIIRKIKQCGFARKAIYWEQNGFVENLGPKVNSHYDDYAPVFSPNYDKKVYFSSNRPEGVGGLRNAEGLKDLEGQYSSDIYAVEMKDHGWVESTGIPPFINSSADEELMDFNRDGTIMFFRRYGGGRSSSFMADTFSNELKNSSTDLLLPALSDLGDRDLFFVNDSTFIFSSKRKGGYGGYDLYIMTRQGDKWSSPKNLGPEVNSIYNEKSPFLTNSGTLLYFSSDRENSIGGYDIYYSQYGLEKGAWNSSENLGYPISSAGNDLFFRLGEDGRSALFSSDREGSMGGYDIFIVYLKNQVFEQSAYADFDPFKKNKSDSLELVDGKNSEKDNSVKKENVDIKPREIVVSPLFFSEANSVADGNNLLELTNLLDIMKIFPDTRVVLSAFTGEENNKAYELYFSIKRAEEAASFLIEEGIASSRISLVGYGAQYPLVKDQQSSLGKRNNLRVDIKLINDNPALLVSYNLPIVADLLRDDRSERFLKTNEKAVYRLWITDSRQLLDDPEIIDQKDVTIYKLAKNAAYNYLVGMTTDYSAILNTKIKFLEKGYKNLKIMVFIDGVPYEKQAVSSLLEKYPNLREYVKYELD